MKKLSKTQLKEIRDEAEDQGSGEMCIAGDAMETILDMLEDAQTHGRRVQAAAVTLVRERAAAMSILRSLEATYGTKALRQAAVRLEEMSLAQALKENL